MNSNNVMILYQLFYFQQFHFCWYPLLFLLHHLANMYNLSICVPHFHLHQNFSKKKKWTKNIDQAVIVKKDELQEYEKLVSIDEKDCKVLNPYFFESNVNGEIISLREKIRSKSIYLLSKMVN